MAVGSPGDLCGDEPLQWLEQQLLAGVGQMEEWKDPSGGILHELFEAVEDGDLGTCREMLQQLEPELIDSRGPDGDTLLHLACLYAFEDIVMLLLEHHASVDVRDEDNSSVLHDSSAGGNLNIVRMLVDRQPELIHAADDDGDTCLHNAARGGHTDIVQFLLLEGAVPTIRNRLGETPQETCGADIVPGVQEALSIAEKQWPAARTSAVQEPETPPSSTSAKPDSRGLGAAAAGTRHQ